LIEVISAKVSRDNRVVDRNLVNLFSGQRVMGTDPWPTWPFHLLAHPRPMTHWPIVSSDVSKFDAGSLPLRGNPTGNQSTQTKQAQQLSACTAISLSSRPLAYPATKRGETRGALSHASTGHTHTT